MSRVDREGPIHRAVVAYLRAVLPDLCVVVHVPNEVQRRGSGGMLEAVRSRDLGAVRGFPDLLVFAPDFVGAIEIKAEGQYPRPDQRAVLDRLAALGCRSAVARSVEDARGIVAAWGLPTKERPE